MLHCRDSESPAFFAFTENHPSKHYPIYKNHRPSSCRCRLLELWIEHDLKMSSQSLLVIGCSIWNLQTSCRIPRHFYFELVTLTFNAQVKIVTLCWHHSPLNLVSLHEMASCSSASSYDSHYCHSAFSLFFMRTYRACTDWGSWHMSFSDASTFVKGKHALCTGVSLSSASSSTSKNIWNSEPSFKTYHDCLSRWTSPKSLICNHSRIYWVSLLLCRRKAHTHTSEWHLLRLFVCKLSSPLKLKARLNVGMSNSLSIPFERCHLNT